MIRPSSLPMLAQCPAFVGLGGEYADAGTARHIALRGLFAGDTAMSEAYAKLDEPDKAGVDWAAQYIRLHAPTGEAMHWERRIEGFSPTFEPMAGTPDLVCGNHLFDFKWRYRDYKAQMAAYVWLLLCQPNAPAEIHVHLLFGQPQRAETFTLTMSDCEEILSPILGGAIANPRPRACDYCGWCAKAATCPALTAPASVVAARYTDGPVRDEISNWHPSQMLESPEDLAFALKLWRNVLKKWGESVEFHAMEAATKRGLKLLGVELKTVKGRKFVPNTADAYVASGLPPEQFLRACDVRLNTSKKYPDNEGLDRLMMQYTGAPTLAAAKREVAKRLGDTIQQRKDGLKLVLETDNNEPNDE